MSTQRTDLTQAFHYKKPSLFFSYHKRVVLSWTRRTSRKVMRLLLLEVAKIMDDLLKGNIRKEEKTRNSYKLESIYA